MNTPNLRDWNPKESEAKMVMDTPMLDVMAKETADTVTATNTNEEKVNKALPFGPLGARGRS